MSAQKTTTNATVKWVDGLKFTSYADSGHEAIMDGPSEHGGSDSAPRPMEMVLMGLGGCTAMDAISILRKKKQDVTGLEVNLKGVRAENHPMRYENVELEFVVRGRGVDEKAAKRAIELSMEKYCSVKFTLERETDIQYTYKVEEG
jgi:putative redox protein